MNTVAVIEAGIGAISLGFMDKLKAGNCKRK